MLCGHVIIYGVCRAGMHGYRRHYDQFGVDHVLDRGGKVPIVAVCRNLPEKPFFPSPP
jgi:hypothetical protein